jgi:hypothetical protein
MGTSKEFKTARELIKSGIFIRKEALKDELADNNTTSSIYYSLLIFTIVFFTMLFAFPIEKEVMALCFSITFSVLLVWNYFSIKQTMQKSKKLEKKLKKTFGEDYEKYKVFLEFAFKKADKELLKKEDEVTFMNYVKKLYNIQIQLYKDKLQ